MSSKSMPDSHLLFWGVVALLAEAILFGTLNEFPFHYKAKMAGRRRQLSAYLLEIPSRESREAYRQRVLGLILGFLLAVVPWASGMMDSHPCWAWGFYAMALACAAYSFWQMAPIARWSRILLLLIAASVFIVCARRSIYTHTELDFAFVHPGVFLVQRTGEWLLIVSGQNVHHPIFNIDLDLQDMVTARAIPNEPDLNRRVAMIQGSTIHKHYDEIGPTFPGDKVIWLPIDVNNQEYEMRATFRIGSTTYSDNETIRIVNVGERFVSANQTPNAKVDWQESITIKNQFGEILMHCVDQRFPRDTGWIDGPVCYPGAKFNPLPRSLCTRCFKRGFEWYSQQ